MCCALMKLMTWFVVVEARTDCDTLTRTDEEQHPRPDLVDDATSSHVGELLLATLLARLPRPGGHGQRHRHRFGFDRVDRELGPGRIAVNTVEAEVVGQPLDERLRVRSHVDHAVSESQHQRRAHGVAVESGGELLLQRLLVIAHRRF